VLGTSSTRRYSGERKRRLDGEYGDGVQRRHRRLGVQRVEQHDAGAVRGRALDDGAQVGVVADAPGRALRRL
jgi:hypothetical protein